MVSPALSRSAAGTDGVGPGAGGQAEAEAAEASEPATPHLPGPSLEGWEPRLPRAFEPAAKSLTRVAVVTAFEVPLYSKPGARWPIGTARVGERLPASPKKGDSCSGGHWIEVSGSAWVCTGEGVTVVDDPADGPRIGSEHRGRLASVDEPLPYLYGRVTPKRGAILSRLPKGDEVTALAEAMESGARLSGLVARWLQGTYFIALSREVESGGHKYYETIEGQFLRAEDVKLVEEHPMHGEPLGDEYRLPMAFVLDETPLLCVDEEGGAPSECGTAERHARFNLDDRIEGDDGDLLVGPGGLAVAASAARVVERTDRPSGVGAKDKWIHIDLSQQALVAYEGDEPVYVTLVSSGRDGFHTPRGLFQGQRKYTTKTMRGTDEDGPYEVGEVPWTLFYDGNYAVHGAYWHNNFGRTRSHGCTNVPPADARWLYYWSDLLLPEGWHEMYHRRGTHVYLSGQTPPDGA